MLGGAQLTKVYDMMDENRKKYPTQLDSPRILASELMS